MSYLLIKEPVIVMHPLDMCYSHAFLDACFSTFWCIQDLIREGKIKDRNVRIIISKYLIEKYPLQFRMRINEFEKKYKGVWNQLINLLTPYPVIFDYLDTDKYIIDKLFVCNRNMELWKGQTVFGKLSGIENLSLSDHLNTSKYIINKLEIIDIQRCSIWNCSPAYENNELELHHSYLNEFRKHIFSKYNLCPISNSQRNVIIIDRTTDVKIQKNTWSLGLPEENRNIKPEILNQLIEYFSNNPNYRFGGIFILEDKSLEEQAKLISENNVFIFRQGSCIANLIFAPYDSLVIDLDWNGFSPERRHLTRRICHLTNSEHAYLNYNKFDIKEIDMFLRSHFGVIS